MELIAQGAEAKLFRDGNAVIKERIAKAYRLPTLDKSLRQFRTRRESKILKRLEDNQFPAPKLQNFCDKRMSITMDFVPGETLRAHLLDQKNQDDFLKLANKLGEGIGKLHSMDIIHGDLTTANVLLNNEKLTFIDFGLSKFTDKLEDKAVDLHLLDRNLESSHYQFYPEIFDKVKEAYAKFNPDSKLVFERLEKVEGRGRHKK